MRVDEHQQRALEPVRLAVDGDEGADPDGGRDGGDLERREHEVHRLADDERRAARGPGATNSATWRLEPKVTAIANSILFLAASWTATRCSARLPIVGMITTPTKKADSPNESMNGSIDADQDLRQDGQQRGGAEQDADRDRAGSSAGRRGPRARRDRRASRRDG